MFHSRVSHCDGYWNVPAVFVTTWSPRQRARSDQAPRAELVSAIPTDRVRLIRPEGVWRSQPHQSGRSGTVPIGRLPHSLFSPHRIDCSSDSSTVDPVRFPPTETVFLIEEQECAPTNRVRAGESSFGSFRPPRVVHHSRPRRGQQSCNPAASPVTQGTGLPPESAPSRAETPSHDAAPPELLSATGTADAMYSASEWRSRCHGFPRRRLVSCLQSTLPRHRDRLMIDAEQRK